MSAQIIDLNRIKELEIDELIDIFNEMIEEAPALGMPEVAAMVQEAKKDILKTVIKGESQNIAVGWYQEELAQQRALNRDNNGSASPASDHNAPRIAYA